MQTEATPYFKACRQPASSSASVIVAGADVSDFALEKFREYAGTEALATKDYRELIQRDDDRPEAVRVRMEAYLEATAPLAEFYAQRNQLVSIAASGAPDDILQTTLRALAGRTQQVQEQARA